MANTARIAVQHGYIGGHALTVLDCWKCGEVFALTTAMNNTRVRDGVAFYCPNGHACYYSTDLSVDQRRIKELERQVEAAKREAERANHNREWAESRAKGANIAAGKAKAAQRRMVERIHAGVCPHCHRTFKQLAAHMKSKHSAAKQE